jgi:hypothetical protein
MHKKTLQKADKSKNNPSQLLWNEGLTTITEGKKTKKDLDTALWV